MSAEFIGLITIFMVLVLYIPYVHMARTKKIKPHPYSWLIWTLLTLIGYMGQLSDGAGPGAWMNAPTALLMGTITFYAFKHGRAHITKFDTILLILGLMAIPAWIITENALISVIIASSLMMVASIPTFRKTHNHPNDDAAYIYGCDFIRQCLSMIAITNISWITMLFPVAVSTTNGGIFVYILWRRVMMKPQD